MPTWVRSSGKSDCETQNSTIGGAAAVVASTLAIAQLGLPYVVLVQVVLSDKVERMVSC